VISDSATHASMGTSSQNQVAVVSELSMNDFSSSTFRTMGNRFDAAGTYA
jgi:hypothetical protein